MILLALRVLISFSTTLMLYYVYLYYAAECEVMKLKNIVPPKATLLSSSLRPALLLELGVLSIHPFPGLEAVDPSWPRLAVATSLLMFSRVALVLRVVQFRNSFNSSNGWFIGALTNVDFTSAFFLKSTLKNHPRGCLLASFATLGGVAGYSLFVAERFLCAFAQDSCCEPMALADALWMLVITILTIGYGDVVPHTTLGRTIAVGAGLFGTLSTAVTIAVMSNYLVLTRSEHKVNAFLKKDENRRLINDQAARALQAFVQLRAAQRRHNQTVPASSTTGGEGEGGAGPMGVLGAALAAPTDAKAGDRSSRRVLRRAELKLFDVLRTYRQVKRRVHSHDVSDPMDSQMTMLEMMEVNVEYIRTKIEELSELFLTQSVDHSRSKHRLSNLMASAALAASSSGLEPSLSPPGGGAVALLQQLPPPQRPPHPHPQLPRQSQAPATSTLQEGDSTTATSKPTAAPTKVDREFLRTPAAWTGQATAVATEVVPNWALMLERSLQSLLEQVVIVADEVEAMKARVQAHADSTESRMAELEKRILVGDALREVTKPRPSVRFLLRQASNSSMDGLSSPRLRHLSTNSRRPSIHQFVSNVDLLEFQRPDDQTGRGNS
ncbi:hypothetical protein BBJ28_00021196 [Nothophytophthora sp. Chile5]|nr:hypothetical protein BBJ28_00021196 [Nothophytophthora sp. Chile5]